MDIVVEAQSRFLINKINTHLDGYLIADVEWYYDVQPDASPSLLDEMEEMFERILEKYEFELEESFWTSYHDAKSKSFKVAEKSGLTLTQQQTLLTLQDEDRRINFLIQHFEKLDEEISKNAGLRNIILGDGYIN
jgi:Lon protease-like protein